MEPELHRLAMGVAYRGSAFNGWQSQPGGRTAQDVLEAALLRFTGQAVRTRCAGRTDTGVHALGQVVHFDTALCRETASWVRGTNSHLPADLAVQWCSGVPNNFHARNDARRRRYVYVLLQSPVRPALEHGLVGWVFRPLDGAAMQAAAHTLLGEHDFSSFRAAGCQARSPVKTLYRLNISQRGAYWAFDLEGSAFLHHMVRNIMGCLLAVGMGKQPVGWMADVLAAQNRKVAAPTFSAAGLYFMGPVYDAELGLPRQNPSAQWLPGGFALAGFAPGPGSGAAPATMPPHEAHPNQDLWPDPRS